MKNRLNSGITVIALVVTLNCLLILTGLSFAMLTGENGTIRKSKRSSRTSKNSRM